MFKSARWRGEKNRFKEAFKLQFHATQVSQPGVEALTVSLVPADLGKPTLRLQKAIVRDGTCRWENPAYETIKFVRDSKTGKINERIYHFIISSGPSKAGFIGQVTIDFSDYAEATKPFTLSLPLENSNTVLHVSIHRVLNIANEREVEEIQDVEIKPRDRSLRSHFSLGDIDDGIKSNYTEDPFSKTTQNNELNGNHRASSGSDITLSSSDTSSGLNTPLELALRSSIQPDPTRILSSMGHSEHSEPMENVSSTSYEEHQKLQWVSLDGSDPGISTDDSMHSPQDTSLVEIEKLKAEVVGLARQADVTELELHTLRKQIVKESKKGQDLSREVVSLKEEKNALEAECEKLKTFQKCGDDTKAINKLQAEDGDIWALLEETRQELNHEKDQNASLRIQLQKTRESNEELILAVRDLDEMLEQKDREISDSWNGLGSSENTEELKELFSKCGTDDDDDEQKALEELVKEHNDATEVYMLEQKIIDLCSELEIYRRGKDELEMQMEHLALDYEVLKQENHDMSQRLEQSALQEQLRMQYECSSSFVNVNELESKVESLEKELQQQSNEFSDSLATIDKLEARIKGLEEELETQARGFEADVEALMHAKVEQEQRAIQAEESLWKTKSKNANAAERIQDEFRRLSTQMATTFEANEKVAMEALTEAGDLRMQKIQLEEMLRKANVELQATSDDYEVKLLELSNLMDLKTNMLLESDKKCKQLESQAKRGEEVDRALSQEILLLIAQVERLTIENSFLAQQAEEEENTEAQLVPCNLKDVKNMREKVELLQGQIKSKEAALETSTKKFLDKEKDLQMKIEELEITMEELNNANFGAQLSEKVEGKIAFNCRTLADDLLTELTTLKEKNNSMEIELKEMQERYSEISLKFAEVEGERQQLVMTVRNLKNANKSK